MADEYLNKNGRPDKSPEGTTASASPVERTPLPDSAVPPQDYQQVQYSYVPPQPEPQEEPKPSRSWWKVLAGLFAGCLVLNLVLGILGVIAFSLMTASCVSSCSDSPVGDSRADASFISARESSKRDLETFDALRGSIDSLYENRGDDADLITPDELRKLVAEGSWPDSSAGYGDTTSARSPQLWVRIAELSEDHIEQETGVDWQIMDFSYPFPNNGPIPVPPKRDESDCTTTRLICMEGDDEGLVATVDYWRWEQPARFSANVAEARATYEQAKQDLQLFESFEGIQGRDVVCSRGNFYLWDLGEDDPLRDPVTFVTLVNQANEALDAYTDVTLLEADTPFTLWYRPLSYDYPNDKDDLVLPFEEGREACLKTCGAYDFENTYGNELLTGYATFSSRCELSDLYGKLAPDAAGVFTNTWRQPNNAGSFDESLVSLLLPKLSGATEDQVIALSETEEGDDRVLNVRTWVVVPRGTLPEDFEGFCQAVNEMRDDQVEHYGQLFADYENLSVINVYTHFYVVDEGTITRDGQPISFAELRVQAKEDPSGLSGCSFDALYAADPYATLYASDRETYTFDATRYNVGGSIPDTTEWPYE